MQPQEQIEQLTKLLSEVNKNNVTHEEVVTLFEELARAIDAIKGELERKLSATERNSDRTSEETMRLIKGIEHQISDGIKKTGDSSKKEIEALKSSFRGQLEAVRSLIPELPDFQGMMDDFYRKIPPPVKLDYQPLSAGRNIDIQGNKIINTNPKITVSPLAPKDPEQGDIWVRT